MIACLFMYNARASVICHHKSSWLHWIVMKLHSAQCVCVMKHQEHLCIFAFAVAVALTPAVTINFQWIWTNNSSSILLSQLIFAGKFPDSEVLSILRVLDGDQHQTQIPTKCIQQQIFAKLCNLYRLTFMHKILIMCLYA